MFNFYSLFSKRKIKVEEDKQNKEMKYQQNLLLCCCRTLISTSAPAFGVPPLAGENTGAHVCLSNVESHAQLLLREALLAVTHGSAPGPADFWPLERWEIAKGREDWQKY